MKYLVKLIKWSIVLLLIIFLTVNIWGLIIKWQGQSVIKQATLDTENAKIATTIDDRKIEYMTYGSSADTAPVIINIHGSGLEASFEKNIHHHACEQLGIRGISISLPGVGNSDYKIGRVVADWAKEDLLAVLEKEKINQFMITGHSQGNPHAMAAAHYFKDRVIGLGLNAPLLPIDVSKEENIKGALAIDQLPNTQSISKAWMGWYFFSITLFTNYLAPEQPRKVLLNTPELQRDTALLRYVNTTLNRSKERGSAGQVWESTLDVCYEWGFDPREITTNNICIWHADDDPFCPPAIGKFLAEFYQQKGLAVNYKHAIENGGHMTYCMKKYRQPKNSMEKALLDQIKQ